MKGGEGRFGQPGQLELGSITGTRAVPSSPSTQTIDQLQAGCASAPSEESGVSSSVAGRVGGGREGPSSRERADLTVGGCVHFGGGVLVDLKQIDSWLNIFPGCHILSQQN